MTYCNIYAHDLVAALGGYLPVIWWNPPAEARIRAGARVVTPEEHRALPPAERAQAIAPIKGRGGTVRELNANEINQWLRTRGGGYGWTMAPGANPNEQARAAQEAANDGRIVIASAQAVTPPNARRERSGHVSVIVAESADADRAEGLSGGESGRGGEERTHTHRERRAADGSSYFIPVESQAGADNFAYGARRSGSAGERTRSRVPWWMNSGHRNGSFWIYDPSRRSSPIQGPGMPR